MIAANAEKAIAFHLSPGNYHDAPEGNKLLSTLDKPTESCSVIMDRAYEGDETRKLVSELGYTPVVPPKKNRLVPWEYDKQLYKKRNEVERLFCRLKGFRRIATRYDKLDIMFMGFIVLALIFIELKNWRTL